MLFPFWLFCVCVCVCVCVIYSGCIQTSYINLAVISEHPKAWCISKLIYSLGVAILLEWAVGTLVIQVDLLKWVAAMQLLMNWVNKIRRACTNGKQIIYAYKIQRPSSHWESNRSFFDRDNSAYTIMYSLLLSMSITIVFKNEIIN